MLAMSKCTKKKFLDSMIECKDQQQAKKSTWNVSETMMKRMEKSLNEQKNISLQLESLEPEQLTQECDSIFICLVCLGIVKLNMKECKECRALFCEDCIVKNNSIQIHSCPKCR
jgi:hypothetical protein